MSINWDTFDEARENVVQRWWSLWLYPRASLVVKRRLEHLRKRILTMDEIAREERSTIRPGTLSGRIRLAPGNIIEVPRRRGEA